MEKKEEQILLRDFESEHSPTRGYAAYRLKNSFDEQIGDRLILFLLNERNDKAFQLACEAVIPKWIVKFERYLSSASEWPLDSSRTASLMRRIRGWRLPSIESRIPNFLESDDWILKLAAVEYCHDKMIFREKARNVCLQFSARAIGSSEDKQELTRILGMKSFRQLMAHVRNKAKDFEPLT